LGVATPLLRQSQPQLHLHKFALARLSGGGR